MAVAPDGAVASGSFTTGTTYTLSVDGGSGNNRFLLARVAYLNNVNAAVLNGVTYDGTVMAFLGRLAAGTSGAITVTVDFYGLVAPSTGTNTLSVTMNNADVSVVLIAESYQGVSQVTPSGSPTWGSFDLQGGALGNGDTWNTDTAGPFSHTTTDTPPDGDMWVSTIVASGGVSLTYSGDGSEVASANETTNLRLAVARDVAAGSPVTVDWTPAANAHAALTVFFLKAAPGARAWVALLGA